MLQGPRRVPPSADGGRGSNRVFRRRVRRKTLCSAHKRARFARATQGAASPRKNACIFEKRVEVFRHAEVRNPIFRVPDLRLSIKCISMIYAARASQSSTVRRRWKRVKPCFPAACTSENTLLSPQACALCACDAGGCIPSKKCLHF